MKRFLSVRKGGFPGLQVGERAVACSLARREDTSLATLALGLSSASIQPDWDFTEGPGSACFDNFHRGCQGAGQHEPPNHLGLPDLTILRTEPLALAPLLPIVVTGPKSVED